MNCTLFEQASTVSITFDVWDWDGVGDDKVRPNLNFAAEFGAVDSDSQWHGHNFTEFWVRLETREMVATRLGFERFTANFMSRVILR